MKQVNHRRQELYVHLDWSTWDREPVVTTEVQQWLWPMLGEEARRLRCAWAVVGGVEDHVHMLCAIPTTLAVAALAQQIKGASARCAGARGAVVRWQRGYGVFSVSPDGVPALEAYVREQAVHHRLGGVIAGWE